MGSIDERALRDGTPSYRARVRRRGHPPLVETFRRKVDAVAWIAETERSIRLGIYADDESRRRTVGELIDHYLKAGCPTLQPRRGELSEMDRRRRKAKLKWWRDRHGHLFLAALTLTAVEDSVAALATGEGLSGEPVGPATRNRYVATLSALLSYGVRIRWISDHPLKGRIARAVEPEPDASFFRREGDVEAGEAAEWPAIKKACRESADRRLYPALLLSVVSGARPAEVWLMREAKTKPLRWDHLDLRRGIGRIGAAKAGKGRLLVVDGDALEALREYARVRPLGAVYVFENERGSAAFPRRAWDLARKAAGVSLTWHRLRHSAASWALMSGDVSLAAIGAFLGHSSPLTTRRYAHLAEDRARSIARVTARDL